MSHIVMIVLQICFNILILTIKHLSYFIAPVNVCFIPQLYSDHSNHIRDNFFFFYKSAFWILNLNH